MPKWIASPGFHRGPVDDEEMHVSGNDDLKAKMREALERKKSNDTGVAKSADPKEKVHGSEVVGGAPKVHRRKAGGGGS